MTDPVINRVSEKDGRFLKNPLIFFNSFISLAMTQGFKLKSSKHRQSKEKKN
jgi:hypothetical protein